MSRKRDAAIQPVILIFINFKICPSVFSLRLLYDELLEMVIQILLLFLHCKTSCCHVYCKEMKQNET
jgi:hypothetical protein